VYFKVGHSYTCNVLNKHYLTEFNHRTDYCVSCLYVV